MGNRYASALLSTLGDKDPDEILGQMEVVSRVFQEQVPLRRLFENPAVTQTEKDALLAGLEKETGLDDSVSRLLGLLIRNRKLRHLPDVVEGFRAIQDDARGVRRITVRSAKDLGKQRLAQLEKRLVEIFGGKVHLDPEVHSDLIGGLQIQVGSTVYDGSVSGTLGALARAIVKG